MEWTTGLSPTTYIFNFSVDGASGPLIYSSKSIRTDLTGLIGMIQFKEDTNSAASGGFPIRADHVEQYIWQINCILFQILGNFGFGNSHWEI